MSDDDRPALVARLVGRRVETVRALASGTDHVAYAVGDDLVARFTRDRDDESPAAVEREARILDAVAGRLPVATPLVVSVHPDEGVLVTTLVPGVALLGLDDGPMPPSGVAETLDALHSIDLDDSTRTIVPADDYPLREYAADAVAILDELGDAMDPSTADRLRAALDPMPPESSDVAFVHNDFGAEHLFVDADRRLCGVIDWADAALADPARDLARVLRDVGPVGYRRVVSGYGRRWDDGFDARVWFLARCAALEDLAYGLAERRPVYERAARRSLTWLLEE